MRVLAGSPVAYQNGQNGQAGPRLTPPPPRFTTVVGLPKTIALQYTTGKPVRSRYNGEMQMMYTLTTGEKAYFPMNVGEAIDSLILAPGQPFTVCNQGGGNWDVERAYPQQAVQAPPIPPQRSEAARPTAAPPESEMRFPSIVAAGEPVTRLESALKTAILAASNAEKYGQSIGYTVRFDTDAIKAMAITVLINMEGGRK
jgi:hypothetical protein